MSEAKEHAAFYVRGREVSTISSGNSEYKKVVEFYKESGKMFIFDKRDAMAFIVWRSKLGVSEMQRKQAMAVINLMYEVWGVESPSKSPLEVFCCGHLHAGGGCRRHSGGRCVIG